MKKANFLIALFTLFMFRVIAQPTVAATTPTRAAANVISVFSDAYTNVSGTDFNPNWGQGTLVSNITVSGNNVLKYQNMDYQGTQLGAAINASSMEKLHVDIWTANGVTFDFYLVNLANGAENFSRLTPSQSGWVSYDIPLISNFNTGVLNNIGQFKFIDNPMQFRSSTTTYYLDNIYFWKAPIVLPVALISFTATTEGSKTHLTWATANEQNNAGFEVERSTDGIYFSKIGFVRGAGNSTTQRDYTFMDGDAAICCGSSTTTTYCGSTYYRLKQTDFDGKYEYSNIVTLGSNTDATVSVYPNPSTGVFTIDGKGWSGQATTAVISNSLGQTYTVAINGNQINLTEFPAGVYFLRLQLGERARVIRLVKL